MTTMNTESLMFKIKTFSKHYSLRFNHQSTLVIALPQLNLNMDEDYQIHNQKEMNEAELFKTFVTKTLGSRVFIIKKPTEIDEIITDYPDCSVIDLHELHPRQEDYIVSKISKKGVRQHTRLIKLHGRDILT